jgi:hypothetical protein
MKYLVLFLTLFVSQPLHAAEAELNLYLSLCPDGAEDAIAAMNLELGEALVIQTTFDADGNETFAEMPIDPVNRALISAAIEALLALTNTNAADELPFPVIAVEWSITLPSNFARGYISLPLDAQPAAILAIQDQIFGARLGADLP